MTAISRHTDTPYVCVTFHYMYLLSLWASELYYHYMYVLHLNFQCFLLINCFLFVFLYRGYGVIKFDFVIRDIEMKFS